LDLVMPRPTSDWTGLSVSQGRYVVRAKLGEGGMGYVYRALDNNLDTDVVIKVPRRSMMEDPEFSSRFAREIRSLVKLAHPNIVKVTDVGEHDGAPFAVMQYLPGGSLEDYEGKDGIAAAASLGLAAIGDWLPGVAAALDFVHSQGYVHRDVKPGNILFDAHGHVFLSDFGVAKALAAAPGSPRGHTAVTGTGMVLGTPEYMAPELIMGDPVDGRIDQYALAVTVYELLAGRRPYEAATPTAVLVMQTTQQPLPLCQVEPRVPRALSDAVGRALAKDPAARFPSCREFAGVVVAAAANVAPATTGPALQSPSGHLLRPDQSRLQCPSCGKSLIFPAALLADPEKVRGKRVACPSCGSRLRVAPDGLSLVAAAPGASTAAHVPVPTRKAVAPLSGTIPVAQPPSRTMAMTAPPAPLPVAEPKRTPGWSITVKAVAAGLAAAVLATTVLTALVFGPSLLRSGEGLVPIDATALKRGAAITLDGQPIELVRLSKPLSLTFGLHELTAALPGYEPYRKVFIVSGGQNPGFKLLLTAIKTPPSAMHGDQLASTTKPVKPPVLDEPDLPRDSPRKPPRRQPSDAAPSKKASDGERSIPRSSTRSVAIFESVPDGPEDDRTTLAELLDNPSAFANRIVAPAGHYVLGSQAMQNPDGTVTAVAVRVSLHARERNLAFLAPVEPPVLILVDPELARNLHSLKALNVTPRTPNLVSDRFGDNTAVLTFHVQKRTDSGNPVWVPVLKKAEFLVGMNYLRIGESKFMDSFLTLTVSTTERQRVGRSPRRDWSTRIGQKYISQIRHLVHNLKEVKYAQERDQMNGVMSNMLGSLLRNNVDPTRMLDQQLRAKSLGR
jgi:DNA-directed RNA polymerase subunit RPC12/RpoP